MLLQSWRLYKFAKTDNRALKQQVQSMQIGSKNTNNATDSYVFNIISFYVFICFKNKEEICAKNVLKYLNSYKLIGPENKLEFIPASKGQVISWSKSKVTEQSVNDYFDYYKTGNLSIFIKLIINLLKTDYEFTLANNEIIQSKFVTYM